MKIHLLSDIHLEFEAFIPPKLDADVVVLAGDIHVGLEGIEWARSTFADTPVIYVLGNHEYYDSNMQKLFLEIKAAAANTNVHVLDNDAITIGSTQFFGCTLWTDFNLRGESQSAKNLATRYINDYDSIYYGPSNRVLRTLDTHAKHVKSLNWLKKRLSQTSNQSVVITHHAPSAKSLPHKFVNEEFEAAYASSLDYLVRESNAALWCHGHIHTSSDYILGKTRVICNPRGYSDHQNPEFNPQMIIEI